MFFLNFLNLTRLGFGILLLYIGYYIHWQLTIGTSRRRMIKDYGCKPVRYIADSNSFNPFKGWDLIRETAKAVKSHTLLELVQTRFLQNGTTFGVKFLHYNMLATIEPENVKTILAANFVDWNLTNTRKRIFKHLIGKGIFTTDGPAWQHSRQLLRPNFVRSQVGNLEMLDRHVDCLLQAIPRDGSTVDLQLLFSRLTLDFATEFLFGESTHCLAPGTSTESLAGVSDALDRLQAQLASQRMSLVFKLFRKFFPNFQSRKDLKLVHSVVDQWVQIGLERRRSHHVEKTNDGRYIFLYELIDNTEDPLKIRSELMNILLASRDTTTSLLSNVFFFLAKKPEIWTKLQIEVEKLIGQRPSHEQIKNMKYLRAVINESEEDVVSNNPSPLTFVAGLRLYPPVQANARMAIVDTVLPCGGGPDGQSPLLIPAKQNVVWSLYSMHRRKDYYGEDAEEFKPERWETLRPIWEYLPFNGGPRVCLGQQLALTEASYTIIRIMQEFKVIESRDPEPWRECVSVVLSSMNGTKVALIPA